VGSRIILHNSVLREGSCSEWDQPLTFSVVVSYLDFLWTLGRPHETNSVSIID